MSRIMKVTCDWCGEEITNKEYQTMTFRRYAGVNHEKVYRLPTMWMCDKCYKRLAIQMSFPPYEEANDESWPRQTRLRNGVTEMRGEEDGND